MRAASLNRRTAASHCLLLPGLGARRGIRSGLIQQPAQKLLPAGYELAADFLGSAAGGDGRGGQSAGVGGQAGATAGAKARRCKRGKGHKQLKRCRKHKRR